MTWPYGVSVRRRGILAPAARREKATRFILYSEPAA